MAAVPDEIFLADYISVLWKWRFVVVLGVLLFAAGSFISSLLTTPQYRAEATIMPISSDGGALASLSRSFLGGGGSDAGMTPEKVMALLKSRRMAIEVVGELGMTAYVESMMPQVPEASREEVAIGRVQAALMAPRGDAGLIKVAALWDDPVWAAKVTNGYVNALARFLNTRSLNFNFQIVDPALPPTSTYLPRTTMNVILGGAAGFIVGALAAFGLEALQGRRRAPLMVKSRL